MKIIIEEEYFDAVEDIKEKLGLQRSVKITKSGDGTAAIDGSQPDCEKIMVEASNQKLDIGVVRKEP